MPAVLSPVTAPPNLPCPSDSVPLKSTVYESLAKDGLTVAIEDASIEKVVLVIHGVGDPPPGGTLNRFARALAQDEKPLVEHQSTVWLGERSTVAHRTQTFPTHIRQLSIHGNQCEMAEVFWGDLSQVKRGVLGLVYGLFQILFGLRYVAYVAADQPGVAARNLKLLGLMSARILQGPVLAITIFLGLITAAALGTDTIWPGSYRDALWTQALVGGCALSAILAVGIGLRVTRSRVVIRFWSWFCIVAVWSSILIVAKAWVIDPICPELSCENCAHPGMIWFCRVLVILLGLIWFVESIVVAAMGVCWFGALAHPRVYKPAINLGFLLPALTVGIWGQAIPMIWVFAREGISKTKRIPEFVATFDEALPLLGVQFLMMVIMALTTCAVLFRYFSWRAKNDISSYLRGKRPPRLIVNSLLQWTLAICTASGVSLVFLLVNMNMMGIAYLQTPFGLALVEINKYAVMLMVPLGALGIFLLPYLRPGFDILLDVVNHFYFRATKLKDALDDDDEFDIKETTFASGSLFFSRRDMIHCRIKKILVYYRERLRHRPELVIISHSQGTMVAVEILNDPEMAWLSSSFSRTSLVTMGSPLTYLYQHYFGHVYPSLNEPFWDDLRQRIDRWINFFRIDDFVGQEIDFPVQTLTKTPQSWMADFGASIPNSSSHPLGCHGHTNYWDDEAALDVLRRELFSEQRTQAKSKAA